MTTSTMPLPESVFIVPQDSSTHQSSIPHIIQILPAQSPFYGKDGRGPFIIKSLEDIILSTDLPIAVDFDHSTDKGASSKAAGWIQELFQENNTLKARILWTEIGKNAIQNKEYRSLSPVLKVEKQRLLIDNKKTDAFIVLALKRVSLTNIPNLNMTSLFHNEKEQEKKNPVASTQVLKHKDETLQQPSAPLTQLIDQTIQSGALMPALRPAINCFAVKNPKECEEILSALKPLFEPSLPIHTAKSSLKPAPESDKEFCQKMGISYPLFMANQQNTTS